MAFHSILVYSHYSAGEGFLPHTLSEVAFNVDFSSFLCPSELTA